jgi:prepilin-type N-terminal cleavage/methylation domain-containing protein
MKTVMRKRNQAGFSLVEMLVVITVIGVIAAIAVPNIGVLTDAADDSKTRRNAQNIASIYSAALAGGADVTGADKEEIIDKLIAGVNGIGAFESHTFLINGLSETEKVQAKKYLKLEGTPLLLTYTTVAQP